jgi:isocitrate dehydrogenase (NAD+)
MAPTVVLVPGDCPESLRWVRALVADAGGDIAWQEVAAQPLPLDAIRAARVALVGWSKGNRDAGELPPGVQLRQALGAYAQLRPLTSVPGLTSRFTGIDAWIVRETTEDVYAHLEHESIPGVFESLKVTTRAACERIARHAFEFARAKGRKKVTIVHKANILKVSDGLFLRVAREVAAAYPDIQAEDVIVDALCMKLVLHPERFDVLLCGNLYGDIVADLGCGLVGGPNNAPAILVAPDGTHVFTSAHGDGPERAGTDAVSLLHGLLPAVHLLAHLGQTDAAARLDGALRATLATGTRPVSAGGTAGPAAFAAAVTERLRAG